MMSLVPVCKDHLKRDSSVELHWLSKVKLVGISPGTEDELSQEHQDSGKKTHSQDTKHSLCVISIQRHQGTIVLISFILGIFFTFLYLVMRNNIMKIEVTKLKH